MGTKSRNMKQVPNMKWKDGVSSTTTAVLGADSLLSKPDEFDC